MANNWAIVIGINQYDNLPPEKHLRYAVQDAEAIAQFLCEHAGFPPDNVLLCSDQSAPVRHISTRPSRNSLRYILLNEIKHIGGADNLWFFFAGHGISKDHRDYLLPADGFPSDEDSAIDIRFVVDCLRGSRARNIVLVLDMCRSNRIEPDMRNGIDTEIGGETQRLTQEQGSDSQSIVTIFACSPGQSSYEIPELEHGSFTHALLEGLQRHTLLDQLDAYLRRTVPELNARFNKRSPQLPLVVPEPGWKYTLPLLPDCTTAADIVKLIDLAYKAERDQQFDKAKNLWRTVIQAPLSTREQRTEALESIDRVSQSTRPTQFGSNSLLRLPQDRPPSDRATTNRGPQSLVDTPRPEPGRPGRTIPTPPRQKVVFWAALACLPLLALLWSWLTPSAPALPADQFSRGDDVILESSAPAACSSPAVIEAFARKQNGVKAFNAAISGSRPERGDFWEARNHFDEAVRLFRDGRGQGPNCPGGDPETLIYLNNTKALTSGQPLLTLAVSVPAGTPENRELAADILRGVAQAQNQINQDNAGIKGHWLQVLIVRDDGGLSGGQPSDNHLEQIAAHLKDNRIPGDRTLKQMGGDILGVIGHYSSDATLAAGTVYDGNLPAISPTSTAVRTAGSPSEVEQPFTYSFELSDWVFRTVSNDQVSAKDLVQRLPLNQKGFIVYDSRSIYSRSTANSFKRALQYDRGGQEVGICDLSTQDCVREVPQRLTASGANVLILAPSVMNLGKVTSLIKSLTPEQRQAIQILGGSSLYLDDFLVDLGESSFGIWLGVAWHRDETPAELQDALTDLWGTRYVSWLTATSYDATLIFAEGLRQASSLNRKGLYRALPTVGIEGMTGSVRFALNHDRLIQETGDRTIGVIVEVKKQCQPNDPPKAYFCLVN